MFIRLHALRLKFVLGNNIPFIVIGNAAPKTLLIFVPPFLRTNRTMLFHILLQVMVGN